MSRKRFTEREVLETLSLQGIALLCHRCKRPMLPSQIEREHLFEMAMGGADDPSNCAYSHKACHALITNGTKATSAGSSKQRIAKVKRLRGETCTGPKKKIQSRGFDKSHKRKWPERKVRFKPKMIVARRRKGDGSRTT